MEDFNKARILKIIKDEKGELAGLEPLKPGSSELDKTPLKPKREQVPIETIKTEKFPTAPRDRSKDAVIRKVPSQEDIENFQKEQERKKRISEVVREAREAAL